MTTHGRTANETAFGVAVECRALLLASANEQITAEAKVAWCHLWDLAGGRAGTVATSKRLVGEACGCSERAGGRALEALHNSGFAEVTIEKRTGQVRAYLPDPRTLPAHKVVRDDGQRLLAFAEEAAAEQAAVDDSEPATIPMPAEEKTADVARADDALFLDRPAGRGATTAADVAPPLAPPVTGETEAARKRRELEATVSQLQQTIAARQAKKAEPPPPIGAAMARELRTSTSTSYTEAQKTSTLADGVPSAGAIAQNFLERNNPAVLRAEAERLRDLIFEIVGDPNLKAWFVAAIIEYIQAGQYKQSSLDRILCGLRRKRATLDNPGAWFVKAMKVSLLESGLRVPGGKRRIPK